MGFRIIPTDKLNHTKKSRKFQKILIRVWKNVEVFKESAYKIISRNKEDTRRIKKIKKEIKNKKGNKIKK